MTMDSNESKEGERGPTKSSGGAPAPRADAMDIDPVVPAVATQPARRCAAPAPTSAPRNSLWLERALGTDSVTSRSGGGSDDDCVTDGTPATRRERRASRSSPTRPKTAKEAVEDTMGEAVVEISARDEGCVNQCENPIFLPRTRPHQLIPAQATSSRT